MIRLMRNKFGPVIIGTIVGFIAFVFIFAIDFTPGAGYGPGQAGTVNGEVITLGEFNRALEQRMKFFEQLNMPAEQLKAFRIRQQVFNQLVSRKLMLQEAERQGLDVSDYELMEAIGEIPAFQVEGEFDPVRYREVLEASRYTPSAFESTLRNDLLVEKWQNYFESVAKVSEPEIEREYRMQHDRRMVRFVRLTPESARRKVKVSDKEVDEYLARESNLNLVKNRYEARKNEKEFKGKKFDRVKRGIARDLIAASKTQEIREINEKLAGRVKKLMAEGASDKRINRILNPYGLDVESSGWVTRKNTYIPGMSGTKEILDDAFKSESPIAKEPKIYESAGTMTVAMVTKRDTAEVAKMTEEERRNLAERLAQQKQREFYQKWMEQLTEEAQVQPNPEIVNDEA